MFLTRASVINKFTAISDLKYMPVFNNKNPLFHRSKMKVKQPELLSAKDLWCNQSPVFPQFVCMDIVIKMAQTYFKNKNQHNVKFLKCFSCPSKKHLFIAPFGNDFQMSRDRLLFIIPANKIVSGVFERHLDNDVYLGCDIFIQ